MFKTIRGPGFFRLILALIVFASHGTRVSIGVAAVYLFFGLSGYWIYQMYVHKYTSTRNPYYTYMVSRLWRLLPTFLLINTAAILVEIFYLHVALFKGGWVHRLHFVFSNLFLLGYNSLPYKPLVPAWSLDLEMQFYIFAPLLVLMVRKRPWATIVASIILTIVSRYLGLPLFTSALFFFVAGLATAALSWKPSPKLASWSLALVCLVMLVCILSPWRGIILTGRHVDPLSIYTGTANLVLALIALPLALFTTGREGGPNDSIFGELSYIVYLLHWIFIVCFHPPRNYAVRTVEDAVMGCIVLALAYLVLRVFDKPMNRRRGRWVKNRIIAPVSV